MSSEISTDSRPTTGFQPWHLYVLLGLAGATVAVWRATDTQPAALLLLSAAAVAAGLVAAAVHYAILAFQGRATLDDEALDQRTRRALEQEKTMVLRSIKELEFDRAMGKVSDVDFAEIDARLRARAVALMAQLDATPVAPVQVAPATDAPAVGRCPQCGGANDDDARFCKSCGQRLRDE
ncbi:MAG: hypothetical protein ABS36_00950 [Acidobacteria bacterium SCN 69-37]|nr:MAG: hypothetical protein ABS36_00950 [Acidobacteria bacterium SCN 69-37]